MLPHHAQEIERLGRQHHFMKSTTDGKVLVVPVINQRDSLTVLDSGAADGTWAAVEPLGILRRAARLQN